MYFGHDSLISLRMRFKKTNYRPTEKTLPPGICEGRFLGFPLSLRVFQGFFCLPGVELVSAGGAAGDSKQINGECDGRGSESRSVRSK